MKFYFTFLFSLILISLSAQLNVELLSQVEFPNRGAGNDVWGYVAPDSTEYAIMGLEAGVSVVNITDPRNPVEVGFIEQNRTIWRDMKTWGEYAYVTSESGDDGVLVIDMRSVPMSISHENIFLDVPSGETIGSCHNIYIDEFGFAYLAGCDVNAGGVEIFDLKPVPGQLEYAAGINEEYSHDVYVRDNKVYSSEIFVGWFAIYDVTDKQNISLIGTQTTPFNFTHNSWLSTDGTVLFTTDERSNAPVAAYDVSDPADIKYLDEFRPKETIGDGVIPHNVHVWDDWLIISYYSDGCIIVDAARPDNLIEVGNFDTFLNTTVGFNGAWGAYPFFPSGTIIIGDIQAGLYVLGPTYKRACHIEGMVTDAVDGTPINNAIIRVAGIDLEDFTRAGGQYKTGTVETGTFEITCSKSGYKTITREITLENGKLLIENFELELSTRVDLFGTVVSAEDGSIIPDAELVFILEDQPTTLVSNSEGNFGINQLLEGNYEVIAGKWGYKYKIISDIVFDDNDLTPVMVIEMERGYEDNFYLDLNWDKEFEGERGAWERVKPIGTQPPGFPDLVFVAPDTDSDDFGNRAYITGQSNDFQAGLLMGTARLLSPAFDPTYLVKPTMTFDYYHWATGPGGVVSDRPIQIFLDNGTEIVELISYTMDDLEVRSWTPSEEFILEDYITVTPTMKVVVEIANDAMDAVEGGFDNFKVFENIKISVNDISDEIVNVYPNPSSGVFEIQIPDDYQNTSSIITINNLDGKRVGSKVLRSGQSSAVIGEDLEVGIYFLQLSNSEGNTKAVRLVKI